MRRRVAARTLSADCIACSKRCLWQVASPKKTTSVKESSLRRVIRAGAFVLLPILLMIRIDRWLRRVFIDEQRLRLGPPFVILRIHLSDDVRILRRHIALFAGVGL